MPNITADYTIKTSNTKEFITIPVERQYIKSITLSDIYQTSGLSTTWALIGLMSGGVSSQHIVSTFSSGYVNKISPISWYGNFPVDPEMDVYAEVYGAIGQQLRLAVNLFKIITTPEGLFHVDS